MPDFRCRKCGRTVLPRDERCPQCGEAHPADDFIGRTLRGNIVIEGLIGSGGMGNVYKGIETHLDRPVAVKVLNHLGLTQDRVVSYFMREARVLGQLRHPNIVAVLDFGRESDGTLFLVMEYIPGLPLDEIAREEGPLPPRRVLRMMIQIASGLQEAHSRNIIHRDLKPGNVLIEKVAGVGDFAKVLDFGIAKMVRQDASVSRSQDGTEFGTAIGTPEYMSPEQAQGLDLDPRTDIYSLGLLLFELLTGRLPFEGDNVLTMLMKRTLEDVPPPSSVAPRLPTILDPLCAMALARNREQRFPDVRAFRLEVERVLEAIESGHAAAPVAVAAATPQASASNAVVLATLPLMVAKTSAEASTEATRHLNLIGTLRELVEHRGGTLYAPSARVQLAVFLPTRERPFVIDAAETALLIRERVGRRFPFARVTIAIAAGPTQPPTDEHSLPTGPGPSAALELARHGIGSQIVASTQVGQLLATAFQVQPWERGVEVLGRRGIAAPQSPAPAQRTMPSDAAASAVGYVGRRSLRLQLEGLVDGLAQGHAGSAVALVGPSGIGKTHTALFLERWAHDRGLLILHADCHPHLNDRAFGPLLDLAAAAAGIEVNADGSNLSREVLDQGLAMLGLSLAERQVFVTQRFDTPWPDGEDDTLPLSYGTVSRASQRLRPVERQRLMTMAMRALLRAVAAAGAAVVVLEDLHLADDATRRCLTRLTHATADLPLLLVATCEETVCSGFEAIPLPRLGRDAWLPFWDELWWTHPQHQCAHDAARTAGPQPEEVAALFDAGAGLPLYLAAWLEAGTPPAPARPLDDLLAMQVDRLPNRLRRLLVIAASLGEHFEIGVLEGLFPRSSSLDTALEAAAASGFLRRSPSANGLWRFRHRTFYEVIRKSIKPAERIRFHQSIYDGLTGPSSQHAARQHLLVTRQAVYADLGQTLRHVEAMGDHFASSGDPISAIGWYQHALRGAPPDPADAHLAGLQLKIAAGLLDTGAHDEALQLMGHLTPVSPQQFSSSAALQTIAAIGAGQPEAAKLVLQTALNQSLRTARWSAILYALRGLVRAERGLHREAMQAFEVCAKILQRGHDELPEDQQHLGWLAGYLHGLSAFHLGLREDAERSWTWALKESIASADRVGVVASLTALTGLWLPERAKLARQRCQNALESTLPLLPVDHVVLMRLLGRALDALGDHGGATTCWQQSLALAHELGWTEAAAAVEPLLEGQDAPEELRALTLL